MKVWVVFSGVGDYYGPYFQAVCSSRAAAESLVQDFAIKTISTWTFLSDDVRHKEKAIANQVEDHEIREVDVIDYGIVGSVGTETPKPLSDLTPR